MTCSDFLLRYTDLRDGELSVDDARRFGEHLDVCTVCRRYDQVISRGTEVLRTVPTEGPKDDFRARLQHSIYALHEERRRRRVPRPGSGAMTLFATIAVVAAVMFTSLIPEPDSAVDLPPLVVEAPIAPVRSILERRVPLPVSMALPFEETDLWTRSNALLYRHSSLYQRHREPGLVLTGLR
jgi:hypothetical protein